MYFFLLMSQNLMHKLRLTEKSSRQQINNETKNTLQMKKKLEDAERKIERLNKIIQVRKIPLLFSNIFTYNVTIFLNSVGSRINFSCC